ncbi:MAG: hypothetical protein KF812_11990 [Fimbriimonadaceae bacterium]|nr:hypothetical protein [Fimbriimonadaceae bacterium]
MKTQTKPPTPKPTRSPRVTPTPVRSTVPRSVPASAPRQIRRPRGIRWEFHLVGALAVGLVCYAGSVLTSQSIAASERAAKRQANLERVGLNAQTRMLADRVRSLESDRAIVLWVAEHQYRRASEPIPTLASNGQVSGGR